MNLDFLNCKQVDAVRFHEIILKVGPDVEEVFRQFKEDLGGILPEELSFGMVAGYLRGRGFTWEESFVGMHQYIAIMDSLGVTGRAEKVSLNSSR